MSTGTWVALALAIGLALACAAIAYRVARGIARRLAAIDAGVAALSADHWHSALLLRGIPDGLLPPPPNGWAAGSDLLVELAKLIRSGRPRLVVELGSGLSSLMMGLELRRQGFGRLVAIEHDADYAARTTALLDSAGLAAFVEVRLAPLTPSPGAPPWYDTARLEDLRNVDLILVDGPPGTLGPRARGAALPFFWPRLRVGGQVMLDDAGRPDEKADALEWSARADCELRWLPVAKGCALLQRTR